MRKPRDKCRACGVVVDEFWEGRFAAVLLRCLWLGWLLRCLLSNQDPRLHHRIEQVCFLPKLLTRLNRCWKSVFMLCQRLCFVVLAVAQASSHQGVTLCHTMTWSLFFCALVAFMLLIVASARFLLLAMLLLLPELSWLWLASMAHRVGMDPGSGPTRCVSETFNLLLKCLMFV